MSLTTKLRAVNRVLEGVGEHPVSSLSSGFSTASKAEDTLDDVVRQILEPGWFFNTERNFPLLPDKEGHIYLPENTLKAYLNSEGSMLTQRGRRLYDLANHTYVFTKTQYIDIVLALPFEELPEAARLYAIYFAKRLFQADYLGEPNLASMQTQDERDALLRLRASETETANFNIFDNPEMQEMQNRSI